MIGIATVVLFTAPNPNPQLGCMWMSEYEDCDGKFFIVRVVRKG